MALFVDGEFAHVGSIIGPNLILTARHDIGPSIGRSQDCYFFPPSRNLRQKKCFVEVALELPMLDVMLLKPRAGTALWNFSSFAKLSVMEPVMRQSLIFVDRTALFDPKIHSIRQVEGAICTLAGVHLVCSGYATFAGSCGGGAFSMAGHLIGIHAEMIHESGESDASTSPPTGKSKRKKVTIDERVQDLERELISEKRKRRGLKIQKGSMTVCVKSTSILAEITKSGFHLDVNAGELMKAAALARASTVVPAAASVSRRRQH